MARLILEFILSRLGSSYQGFIIELNNPGAEKNEELLMINGNSHEYTGPISVLSVDQNVVYGLSKREVATRILERGPQILLSTPYLATNLFEHGMKAALGKVRVNNNTFLTSMETYYKLEQTIAPHFQIVPSALKDFAGILFKHPNLKQDIFITHHGFNPKDYPDNTRVIILDTLRDYISLT